MFIHVTKDGFGAIGHVDLCYKGRIISFGNYDTNSSASWNDGRGTFFLSADRENTSNFVTRKS